MIKIQARFDLNHSIMLPMNIQCGKSYLIEENHITLHCVSDDLIVRVQCITIESQGMIVQLEVSGGSDLGECV